VTGLEDIGETLLLLHHKRVFSGKNFRFWE